MVKIDLILLMCLFVFCSCNGLENEIQRLKYEISSEDFLYSFVSKNRSFVINNLTTKWPDYKELLKTEDFVKKADINKADSDTIQKSLKVDKNKKEIFNYDVANDQYLQKLIQLPVLLLSCHILRDEFIKNGKVFIATAESNAETIVKSAFHSFLAVLKGEMYMEVTNASAHLTAGNMLYIPANQESLLKVSEHVLFVNFTLPSKIMYHAVHCNDRPSVYAMTHDIENEYANSMFIDHTLPNITLNTGSIIPPIGLGTGRLFEKTYEVVKSALSIGYRLIDTAQIYSGEEERENFLISSEQEIGRALIDSGLERNEIFLVTKIDPEFMTYQGTLEKTMASLRNLKTEYIDAVLIHDFSASDFCSIRDESCNLNPWISWRALEELQSRGLIRNIGVSNINSSNLNFLVKTFAKSKVSIVQNWFDPLHQDKDVRKICKMNNITYIGYR